MGTGILRAFIEADGDYNRRHPIVSADFVGRLSVPRHSPTALAGQMVQGAAARRVMVMRRLRAQSRALPAEGGILMGFSLVRKRASDRRTRRPPRNYWPVTAMTEREAGRQCALLSHLGARANRLARGQLIDLCLLPVYGFVSRPVGADRHRRDDMLLCACRRQFVRLPASSDSSG